MAVNMGCVDYQRENDALKRQLAAISARRDELERWYSEHVASTAQLRDDLAAAQREAESNDRHAQEMVSIYQATLAKLDVAEAARKRNLEQLDAAQKEIEKRDSLYRILREHSWTVERELDAANARIKELQKGFCTHKAEQECTYFTEGE